ncbi:MAG TPA: hypothetical protein VK154_16450 [Chitinophagales bacterium]|nr:hypothetical protein [Chitinophagales bacterium]
MIDNSFSIRLQEQYRILSEEEKRELNRYLSSAYFNRDAALCGLHTYLCLEQPEEERYDNKLAWKHVFAKAPYNEKKFRYMVSDLLAAIEEFIYTRYTLTHKPQYVQVLDEYYSLREATENKTALANKIMKRAQAKKNVLSPGYFLEQHFTSELIEELHTGSLKTYSKFIAANKKDEPSGLDVYYLIEKLRQMCLVANDNNVFGTTTKCFNAAETLQLASLPKLNSNPFVQAYRTLYRLITEKTDEQYFAIKKIIAKHGYDFEDKNLAELFAYARNFCISRVNAGQGKFFDELFELYQQGLQKRVLLLNGEINERNFKNIVTTALRTKQYDWTLDFINEYRYQLNKVVRENAYNYNMANYLFHTGQYDKALRNLQKVQLGDLFYGLDARSLMLKCYFELDEKEAFLNAYYSFRVFVQRRKNVSEQHRKNYLNFLRIAKKLMNLRVRDKGAIVKLQGEIASAKALADKNWLQEKLQVYL